MDLTAYNTERFQLSIDVSAWATAYDLTTVTWRLQVRVTAATPVVALDIPTGAGSVTYSAGVIIFVASKASVTLLLGAYAWDFGFTPPGGDFIRCDGGTCTFLQGVTR